ncbi:MAG: metal-dependent hydrolase, partial [Burkholderiales bacterium]
MALAKAGVGRGMRGAVPMLLAAGLAADLDWLAYFGGPRVFVSLYRTWSHSLVWTVAIAAAVAGVYVYMRKNAEGQWPRFRPAFLVCLAGAGLHLLLDLGNPYGVKLLWPFSGKWFAWDLLTPVDPWLLFLLAAGLLLPALFRLVTEEIGAKPKRGGRGAAVALVLTALYFGGRWILHERAEAHLMARMYHGAVPMAAGAFPQAASPFN